MKSKIVLIAITILGFSTLYAQDNLAKKANNGGFYAGINIGVPLSYTSDVAAFNFGFEVAYLFEVIENLEVGGLIGYTHFIGKRNHRRYYGWDDDHYYYYYHGRNYPDVSFIPIAASARYYFGDHKFFGGLDLGVAANVAGRVRSGFYVSPKFGFDLGKLALIVSLKSISGGVDYDDDYYEHYYFSGNGFSSFNFGVEFAF